MMSAVIILMPFAGTILGATWVFFLHGGLEGNLRRVLSGFAAGVMTAASIFSLLLPAIDRSAWMGGFSFMPAVLGFWIGVLFLMLLDRAVASLQRDRHYHTPLPETSPTSPGRLLYLAVTLHNLPEGMAVGVALAALLDGGGIALAEVFSLSLGIAIQNLPEGAIISMPLYAGGTKKSRAFLMGAMSGVVEPLGAALTLVLSHFIGAALPYLLSFAAGAMIYVVVEELVPEMSSDAESPWGTLAFTVGFTFMMALDVALG